MLRCWDSEAEEKRAQKVHILTIRGGAEATIMSIRKSKLVAAYFSAHALLAECMLTYYQQYSLFLE